MPTSDATSAHNSRLLHPKLRFLYLRPDCTLLRWYRWLCDGCTLNLASNHSHRPALTSVLGSSPREALVTRQVVEIRHALAIGCDLLAHEVHAISLPEDKLCLFGILQAFLQVAHPTTKCLLTFQSKLVGFLLGYEVFSGWAHRG